MARQTARVFSAPASEEVARFVGVETIVTGQVLARAGGVTVVEVAGRKVEVAAAAAPGDRVRLCLRPEDVIDDMDFTPLVAPAMERLPAPTLRELAVLREEIDPAKTIIGRTARGAEAPGAAPR